MLNIIAREVFYILLIAFIIFTLMEISMPNIVQAYINVNLVLILWLTSGIVLLYD